MKKSNIYLDVPFKERDQAKAAGAQWDPEKKSWYIPASRTCDVAVFSRWLPSEEELQQAKLSENGFCSSHQDTGQQSADILFHPFIPIIAVGRVLLNVTPRDCWSCNQTTRHIGILLTKSRIADNYVDHYLTSEPGSPHPTPNWIDVSIDGLVYISHIKSMPVKLQVEIQKLFPNYFLDYSKAAGHKLYMNHCDSCGMKQGDFFFMAEHKSEGTRVITLDTVLVKGDGFWACHHSQIRQIGNQRSGRFSSAAVRSDIPTYIPLTFSVKVGESLENWDEANVPEKSASFFQFLASLLYQVDIQAKHGNIEPYPNLVELDFSTDGIKMIRLAFEKGGVRMGLSEKNCKFAFSHVLHEVTNALDQGYSSILAQDFDEILVNPPVRCSIRNIKDLSTHETFLFVEMASKN